MTKLKTVSRILEIKEQERKEKEFEVRRMKDIVEAENGKFAILEKDFKKTIMEFTKKQDKGFNANELDMFYNYFSHISERMNAQRNVINKKVEDLEQGKKNLIEAHRKMKLLETLMKRILKKGIKVKNSLEQKEMDFLSLSRRTRE